MNEYRIALRRAWQAESVGGNVPARVDLPMVVDSAWGIFRLVRRFHTPEIDARAQEVLVRLEQVAGLRRVSIDGEVVAAALTENGGYEISVSAERGSRIIELEVDAAHTGEPQRSSWGHVHVIIRERGNVGP